MEIDPKDVSTLLRELQFVKNGIASGTLAVLFFASKLLAAQQGSGAQKSDEAHWEEALHIYRESLDCLQAQKP
jgi:hypothetical protein